MRKYRKWVLTLGIIAATPGLSHAQFSLFKKPPERPAPTAKSADGNDAARPSNQKVAEDIASALRSARLAGYEIEIEYKSGVATLKGIITDPRQKDKATAVVSRVPGVESVDNQLRLITKDEAKARRAAGAGVQQASYSTPSGGTLASNQQTAERVAAALQSAQLDGYDIEIRFQHGVAQLDGSVGTEEQRDRATKVVSMVPGVQTVDNRLKISGVSADKQMAQRPVQTAAYQPMPPAGPMPPAVPPAAAPAPGMEGVAPYCPPGMMPPGGALPPGATVPGYAAPGMGSGGVMYNMPALPEHAWPSYAQYPNTAAVNYPTQYSASAWPYIGPFYPYPQVPLGWREAQLEWDDGYWHLNFRPRTGRWFWFMNPHNW